MQIGRNVEERPVTNPRGGCLWNILTVFVLLGIIVVLGVYYLIFSDPNGSLNPFPPPTQPVALVMNTIPATESEVPFSTVTQTFFPPTWTASPSLIQTETPTPKQVVIFPTNTPISLTPEFCYIYSHRPSGYAFRNYRHTSCVFQDLYLSRSRLQLDGGWGAGG